MSRKRNVNCLTFRHSASAKVDRDLTVEHQEIVASTVRGFIASGDLPPNANRLVVSNPRTAVFYLLPKFTNLEIRAAQSCLLAVVPLK